MKKFFRHISAILAILMILMYLIGCTSIIEEERDYPCQYINPRTNNNYLFKVTYFDKKINIEFFHTLTDGNSGSVFFKEIIYNYLDLRYPNILKIEKSKEKVLSDSENAYIKN